MIIQGDAGDCLYIIVSGEVQVVIEGVGEVARRRERDVIGEMAVISSNLRSAHCIAEGEVTALKISRDDFWELMRDDPSLALGVIRVLSARLDESIANFGRFQPPPY